MQGRASFSTKVKATRFYKDFHGNSLHSILTQFRTRFFLNPSSVTQLSDMQTKLQ